MPKRILVVASTFPSSTTDPVPAFVRDQIVAMKKLELQDFEFSVLAPHDRRSNTVSLSKHPHYDEYRFHYFWPFHTEKLAGRGIMPALKANPLNYILIPFLFTGEFFALLQLTRKLQPALLYAHWFTPQAINARLVGAITRTPFVFTTHAADVDVWRRIPLIGGFIVRNNVRQAKAFTAVSRRSMAKLERFFTPSEWKVLEERSAIIPMGVDLPDTPIGSQENESNQKTILFVGRLAEKKGLQFLLPAYAAVARQTPGIRLVVAGSGPWLDRLKTQANNLGIRDRVDFPGFVSGEEKNKLIKSADVYVVPSIITDSGDAEGLPVSLMEGLAYSKVCIATNESGADNILTDGVDGFLLPHKSADLLAGVLLKALSLPADKRIAMQRSARLTAAQFDWKKVAQDHMELLLKKGIL